MAIFRNLAGAYYADRVVVEEMTRCGIEVVEDPSYNHVEVKTHKVGALRDKIMGHVLFKLHRNWYYWVVEGPVPLHVAEELYANKIGRTDIRVAGHCGCPPPKDWLETVAADGRKVIPTNQLAEFEKHMQPGGILANYDPHKDYVFSDEPEKHGKPVVPVYHIDSEVGLYIFVETLRNHGIVA